MVVETYSDKEVAVGTCEMTPDMFNEAIKVTKEAIDDSTDRLQKSQIAFNALVSNKQSPLLLTKYKISHVKCSKLKLHAKH